MAAFCWRCVCPNVIFCFCVCVCGGHTSCIRSVCKLSPSVQSLCVSGNGSVSVLRGACDSNMCWLCSPGCCPPDAFTSGYFSKLTSRPRKASLTSFSLHLLWSFFTYVYFTLVKRLFFCFCFLRKVGLCIWTLKTSNISPKVGNSPQPPQLLPFSCLLLLQCHNILALDIVALSKMFHKLYYNYGPFGSCVR